MMPRLLLLALLFFGSAVCGCKENEKEKTKDLPVIVDLGNSRSMEIDDNVAAKEVKLTIDTGDPKVTTVKVPYAEKTTVRDVLKAAESQGITAVYQGEGEGALLQSLQGISNQGGGKDAKNWIFYVNNKQATISSAVYSLQPGDAIIWRFEKYE